MCAANMPAVRFEGFEEAWEELPFSSLYAKHDERNDLGLGSEATISVASMTFNSEGNGAAERSLSNYKLLRIGDAAFEGHTNNEFSYGRFVVNDAGTGLMSPRFTAFRPITDSPVSFWSRYLHSERAMKDVLIRSTKLGTMMNELVVDDFLAQSLPVPTLAEQEKIGALFERLDSLIESRTSELERLKESKAALLSKMFPREGEVEPEIRFVGFEGAWERCEVGDFYDFKNGVNKSKEFFGNGVPIVNYTDVYNNRGLTSAMLEGRVDLTAAEVSSFEIREGDLLFTRTSETIEEIGYNSVMLDQPERTVFSGFVLRGRAVNEDPLDNLFKRYVFFTEEFRAEMKRKSSMTTRALTSSTALRGMLFCYPADKSEQQKIGEFFQRFDDLVADREQEIECLKRAKQALLQAMFA